MEGARMTDDELDRAIDEAVESIVDARRGGPVDIRIEADEQIRHLLKRFGVKYSDEKALIGR
jgi:hypothetical protein